MLMRANRIFRRELPTLPAAVLAALPRDVLRQFVRRGRGHVAGLAAGWTTRRLCRVYVAAAAGGFHGAAQEQPERWDSMS